LDKAVAQDKAAAEAKAEALTRKEFFCLRDAQAAAEALSPGGNHHFSCSFATRPVYTRGRPPKNGHRRLLGRRYRVVVGVIEDRAAIEKLREEAGCFGLWMKRNGRIFRRWTCPWPSSRRWTQESAGSELDMSSKNYPKRLSKKCEIWDNI
jgi:hypothetical protein